MSGSILLFGGTFDPVHHGHLIVARAASELLGSARILLIPTGRPPHKAEPQASGEDRLAMLRAAVAGEEAFEVCDLELRRPGPSYTVDTVRDLRARLGGDVALRWLIGVDMLEDLDSWRHVNDLLDMTDLAVAARPPWRERVAELLSRLEGKVNSRHLARLSSAVLRTPQIDISSTEIRRRISEDRPVRFLAPDAVVAYIYEKGLYGRRQM